MSEGLEPTDDVRPWTARKAIELWTRLRPRALKFYARAVFKFHATRMKAGAAAERSRIQITLAGCVAFVAFQVVALVLAHRLDPYFADKDAFGGLKSFCLGMGAALVGATAIASSFILFAMQVNVERMPAGLFRRLSTDNRLLSAFGLAFLVSALVAVGSLAPSASWASFIVLGTAEASLAMPLIYLYAYRRALKLINPTEQLRIPVSLRGGTTIAPNRGLLTCAHERIRPAPKCDF